MYANCKKVYGSPKAYLDEVMNLQLNSPLMGFVIGRGSSPPSNLNYLLKYFELFSAQGISVIAQPTETIIV